MKLEFKLADIVAEHEFKLADVVDAHEIQMDAMRLKIKNIRKYAISQEAWYHYAVGSIITLVAILIAFVVGFKFFRQLYVSLNACFMRTMYYIWSLLYFGLM